MILKAYQRTDAGSLYIGKSEELLVGSLGAKLKGKIQLIFTSPPFPLNLKKQYGNLQGEEYIEWFSSLAPIFSELLTPDGSIVIELGNAWEPGRPVQSLLPMKSLMRFAEHEGAGLRLCQEFICHNPTRLPSPAQWVTIERIRVTDSYTHVWWLSRSDRPKANNRNVLRPYSKATIDMQRRGKYNDGERPSGHNISKDGFLKDNGGSIMHNVIEVDPLGSTYTAVYNEDLHITQNLIEVEPLGNSSQPRIHTNAFSIAHTNSNDYYQRGCKERGIEPHPARMQLQLIDFFIHFLTDEDDTVLDPFAGSNATGFCAERVGRNWVGIEANKDYGIHSQIRFSELKNSESSTTTS